MTKKNKGMIGISKLNLAALAAGGLLLLTMASGAQAQAPEDATAPRPPTPGGFITSAPATVPDEGDDDSSLEFVAPARSLRTAPTTVGTGGSSLVSPADNMLSGSRIQLPPRDAAITLVGPQSSAHSLAAKTSLLVLLGGSLLAGVAAVRFAQGRTRTLG